MKPTQKRPAPRELFGASIAPSWVDAENRAVDAVLYTGAKVRRGGFFSDPYFLTLSLDPAHIRLGRLNNGASSFMVSVAKPQDCRKTPLLG